MPKLSPVPPPAATRDVPVWHLTASELSELLRGETVVRKSRPFKLKLDDDLLERELESVVERALR